MKKITILIAAITILLMAACNTASNDSLNDATNRAKIISDLMNNDTYMKEVMDSMGKKHGDMMLSNVCDMSKSDMHMQEAMMDNMHDMCKMDSTACKMMMGKTMDMCEKDPSKCEMMKDCMKSHPGVMKSMEGMCGMNGKDMKGMDMKGNDMKGMDMKGNDMKGMDMHKK